MIDDAAIKLRHAALAPILDERGRRRFAAAEALAAGRGGVAAVARITGQTIVQLIAATTTETGLKVQCEIDPNTYPAGIKVSDTEINAVNLERHDFHGDWNYTISPQFRRDSS